jgi:ribosomal protein S18 acetylase RimI-like enzyme
MYSYPGGVLNDLMRAGWPALEEVDVDGWVARFSAGVTRRANSVLPVTTPPDREAALARVESLYAERGLPAVFQLAGGELDQVLATRGYELTAPTSTQTTRIGDVSPVAEVTITETPDQAWLDLWWSVDGRGDADALAVAVKILTGGPALYATLRDDHGAAAIGRLALVGEWGGVYCMAVRPDVRRRGLGSAVLRGLLAAGRERGCVNVWLHVLAENTGAKELYARFGFTEVSAYHYRTKPLPY